VILDCNFEELRALASGAELLLAGSEITSGGPVAAPAEALAPVTLLQPRLTASLSIGSLSDQRSVRRAVATICDGLWALLNERVLEFHPAHEEAVALYFEYAHTYGVLRRLDHMGAEMAAMIELITGAAPTEKTARSVSFPD